MNLSLTLLICFIKINFGFSLDAVLFGEGLHPEQKILPLHYFYLQFMREGVNTSIDSNLLNVKVFGQLENGHGCRVTSNFFEVEENGLFLIRYLLYETCLNLEIHLKYKDNHIGDSPFKFQLPVYSEKCRCPKPIEQTLKLYECPASIRQIDEDLRLFPEIDFSVTRKEILSKFNQPNSISLCNYVIKNNQIYRKCYGKYTGFKMFMDGMLQSMAKKAYLPDTEFFVNLGDWPLITKKLKALYPIFSWSKSKETFDIICPTYELTESTLHAMTRVSLDMTSVQKINYKWSDKIEKGFFRGRDSRQERLSLIRLARKYPDLINASLTNFFFYPQEEKELGPKVPHISFYDFFQYKYQIGIDGTVSSYRLPYLLAGNSVIFKQDSNFIEHFYKDMEPNVHYIPIKRDLTDLVEKINWARENDDAVREIIKNGRTFARDHLMPSNIYCYYFLLLKEYSLRIISPIEVPEDFELVEDNSMKCNCGNRLKDEF